jgi:hypothetical protein
MYWIEDADAVDVMPTLKPASTTGRQYFQAGTPRAGRKATIVTEDFLNIIQCELLNVVEESGIAPDKMDLRQLALAIKALSKSVADTAIETYITENPDQFSGGGDLVYPSAFINFFKQTPPSGWRVRNGATISNASNAVPELWQYLLQPANVWMCISAAQWQTQSNIAGGVGGVPWFVLDQVANTVRLPDTRGDYERHAGGGTMPNVGGWHGDAIRDIIGHLYSVGTQHWAALGDGAFTSTYTGNGVNTKSVNMHFYDILFAASSYVQTASENRTRAFGVLGCVYVGTAA